MPKNKPQKSAWWLKKASPVETVDRSHGTSHMRQKLNQWPEENMAILLNELNAAPKFAKPKVKPLAEKYWIPVTSIWKCVNEKVKGTGHKSGGPRHPKVLSKGMLYVCYWLVQANTFSTKNSSTSKYKVKNIMFQKMRLTL